MSEEASVRIPVTVTKNPGRKAGYTASYGQYPHDIEARGATAAEARANLTAALATALTTIRDAEPSFARDDDGTFMVAVPAADGGSHWWRVGSEKARRNAMSSHPAAEAFTGIYHFTVIPNGY
jgi:predicted RNase H-like HicB family nuclease